LDDFFEYKQNSWPISGAPVRDDERHAFLHAARWLMIPLTRAIDTLVIQVSSRSTPLKAILRKVADTSPDYVEWHTM
jgi:hypothetical protein